MLLFFKQKTADDVRISDLSSYLCSSDLFEQAPEQRIERDQEEDGEHPVAGMILAAHLLHPHHGEQQDETGKRHPCGGRESKGDRTTRDAAVQNQRQRQAPQDRTSVGAGKGVTGSVSSGWGRINKKKIK